jgi:hypothetical protein
MRKKYFKIKSGYTIIETMIAISLFIIIIMAGMGALLNANLLHQKSRDMRSVIDSLSFIMEDMSRNLRTGYDYHCIDDGIYTSINTHSCANGAGVSFKSAPPTSQWVYFVGTYNGKSGIFKSIDGGTNFIQLTSDQISINTVSSGFLVRGAEPPPSDSQQPFVTIRLVGTITSNNVTSSFSLQTSVSQRIIDI